MFQFLQLQATEF